MDWLILVAVAFVISGYYYDRAGKREGSPRAFGQVIGAGDEDVGESLIGNFLSSSRAFPVLLTRSLTSHRERSPKKWMSGATLLTAGLYERQLRIA